MTINERLRYIRKNVLCITQAQLASELGVKQTTVGAMEKRNKNITEQTIKHFCIRYNVNEEWLRTGRGKILDKQLTLDAFASAHKASDAEIEAFKKFLCIEPELRRVIIEKMLEIFNCN